MKIKWAGLYLVLNFICLLTSPGFSQQTTVHNKHHYHNESDTTLIRLLQDANIPEYQYQTLNTYPYDNTRFTQGLVLNQDHLFASRGLYHHSQIEQIDKQTGETVIAKKLPSTFFGEGITAIDDRLYQLTYREHLGFIYQLPSLTPIQTFKISGEGWGLTNDGQNLILSDGSAQLTYLSTKNFTPLKQLTVRIGQQALNGLNELEYVEGQILANVLPSSIIVMISLTTGQVTGWLDISQLKSREHCAAFRCVANGIAYDSKNQSLLVTGKLWSYLYEIRVAGTKATTA